MGLGCNPLYPQHLAQGLAHSRCSAGITDDRWEDGWGAHRRTGPGLLQPASCLPLCEVGALMVPVCQGFGDSDLVGWGPCLLLMRHLS